MTMLVDSIARFQQGVGWSLLKASWGQEERKCSLNNAAELDSQVVALNTGKQGVDGVVSARCEVLPSSAPSPHRSIPNQKQQN